jgi:hypothetical protein
MITVFLAVISENHLNVTTASPVVTVAGLLTVATMEASGKTTTLMIAGRIVAVKITVVTLMIVIVTVAVMTGMMGKARDVARGMVVHRPPYVDVTCHICTIHGHLASDCGWHFKNDSDDDGGSDYTATQAQHCTRQLLKSPERSCNPS